MILLNDFHTILTMLVPRIGMGSADNPVIDIFLSSHYLSAWYCTDIVRKNSVMVTHGIVRLNDISVRSDVLYRGKLGYDS